MIDKKIFPEWEKLFNGLRNEFSFIVHEVKYSTGKLIKTYVEINTPFTDGHGDCIQLYVERFDDTFRIHDDGYITFEACTIGGIDEEEDKFKDIIKRYRLNWNDGVLERICKDDLTYGIIDFIQAMIIIDSQLCFGRI